MAKYTLLSSRYGAPNNRTFDSLDDALDWAAGDFEFGTAYSRSIVDETGKEVANFDAILARVHELFDDPADSDD